MISKVPGLALILILHVVCAGACFCQVNADLFHRFECPAYRKDFEMDRSGNSDSFLLFTSYPYKFANWPAFFSDKKVMVEASLFMDFHLDMVIPKTRLMNCFLGLVAPRVS